jgi:hypothetical protein
MNQVLISLYEEVCSDSAPLSPPNDFWRDWGRIDSCFVVVPFE